MRVMKGFGNRVFVTSAILAVPFLYLLRDYHIGITTLATFTTALTWNALGELLFAYHGEEDA